MNEESRLVQLAREIDISISPSDLAEITKIFSTNDKVRGAVEQENDYLSGVLDFYAEMETRMGDGNKVRRDLVKSTLIRLLYNLEKKPPLSKQAQLDNWYIWEQKHHTYTEVLLIDCHLSSS